MTRDEAINCNKNLKMYMRITDKNNPCKFSEDNYIALDMAIESLNREQQLAEMKDGQCSFCEAHEQGDTLYESSSWDGGIGFDYIRNINYCPLCGERLKDSD